jgi:hypothetical protein
MRLVVVLVVVLLAQAAVAVAARGSHESGAGAPHDFAVGNGKAESPGLGFFAAGRVTFSARGGPLGEDADGHVNLELTEGTTTFDLRARVTCVEVVAPVTFAGIPGAIASIHAALEEPVETPRGFTAQRVDLFVFDDGTQGSGSLDFIGIDLSPLPPASAPPCFIDGFFGFSGQELGRANVLVHDAFP